HDLAERAGAAQQEDRPEALDCLFVALLARHGPDLALIRPPVDDEAAVGAEADLRLAQRRGRSRSGGEDQAEDGEPRLPHGSRWERANAAATRRVGRLNAL